MKAGKAVGPDLIPVEIWKCLSEAGLDWLMGLFNVIFRTVRCLMNGGLVHLFRFIRTRVISRIVIIIVALNCLVTL